MIRSFAAPYAKAFAQVYPDPKVARAVHSELQRLRAAMDSHDELRGVLENPAIAAEKKQAIIEGIAASFGLGEQALRIVGVLAQNQRLHQLGPVLDAWLELIHRQTSTVVAKVRAAHQLSESEQDALRAALEKRMGKTVEMEITTDPSLVAGFVAQIGSDLYDASVKGQIRRLETGN